MSVKERINQIRENSDNWRTRVTALEGLDRERLPSVQQIRDSLVSSQDGWRRRVEDKDVENFTVAGRICRSSPFSSPEPKPSPLHLSDAINFPHRPPPTPIIRVTAKDSHPAPISLNLRDSTEETVHSDSAAAATGTDRRRIVVPSQQTDALLGFFGAQSLVEPNTFEEVQFPDCKRQHCEVLQSQFHRIAATRRAVRPGRRAISKTPNPLKSLSQRMDLKSEYDEIRSASVLQLSRTPIVHRRSFHSTDVAEQPTNESSVTKPLLLDSVLKGLSGVEDFSEAKNSLRRVTDDQPLPLTSVQRQLLPYKPLMLIHVKGRRYVQLRLVCPSADSMNSGDCFVLVTPEVVFAWFGAFANVVEVNAARELAMWVCKSHELGYRGTSPAWTGYVAVYEDTTTAPIDTTEVGEFGVPKSDDDEVGSAAMRFWRSLGYDSPQDVHSPGAPDEDDLYELLIQHTNRVYQVTVEQLVPCAQFWGNPVKHSLLRSDHAYVFDFGSEVYLWTGTQISPEIRSAGIELVQQAYQAPYDYSHCRLNPLDPLCTHGTIPLRAESRPTWTLVGKVTEKGETVLFRGKFSSWSGSTHFGVPSNTRQTRIKNMQAGNSVYATVQPYSEDQLYAAAFTEPPPPPLLLTLDGRFVGRGGEGCRYEDGIIRRHRVDSGPLRIWHVSEFSLTELPDASHGQLHQADAYVIRWPFRVTHVGLRDIPRRTADRSQEQCAYFFWQGSQSKVTEQGAAALMTVELDEERGPQIRVTEGKEPPAFCRLFNGRMVVHFGKRCLGSTSATPSIQPRIRLFIVRGEIPVEGYLLEVPARLSSLRPQGVFLVVQYSLPDASLRSIQKAWLWCGRFAPEASVLTGRHIVEQLKDRCPMELGSELRSVLEVQHTESRLGPGELVFLLNAEDSSLSASICLNMEIDCNPLVIWQLTLPSGHQMTARRLEYTLQPDSSLPPSSVRSKFPPTGSALSDSSLTEVTEIAAEQLRSPVDTIKNKHSNSGTYVSFPFLLGDLYNVSQPALFLVLSGKRVVYLWQGWWPRRSRCRLSSSRSQCSFGAESNRSFDPSDGEHGDDCAFSDEPMETVVTGSARVRFHALRQAALQTASNLAAKLGVNAFVVYSGLEPPEFLSLFPPYTPDPDAGLSHQHEGSKEDGCMDPVDLLLSSGQSYYTLVDLQRRPLLAGLDATRLEVYLNDEEFQDAFQMTRNEFDQLPLWKKSELKKRLGLF